MANSGPGSLFGSAKKDQTSNANTSNTTTSSSTNTTGDIGFTGKQGADVLGEFVKAATQVSSTAFTLSNTVSSRSLDTIDRTALRTEETLNNQINAVRDYTQRNFNVSSGQSTPLDNIPTAATTSYGAAGGSTPIPAWVWILIAGVGLLMLGKKNG